MLLFTNNKTGEKQMVEFSLIKVTKETHELLQLLSDKRKRERHPMRSQIDIADNILSRELRKELKK